MDCKTEIETYLYKIKNAIEKIDISQIIEVVDLLNNVKEKDATVFVFGNGGSASTASHIQNDFSNIISGKKKKKFNVIALSDNVTTITAIANDYSYDNIFSYQLDGRLKADDIIIAISASGNSKNILQVAEYAKSCGNKIIALTGFDGGKLMKIADINLHVSIDNMQVTEDLHLIFNHLIVTVLKNMENNCEFN